MNCPKCGNLLGKGRSTCRHCGARITLPSETIRRQMSTSARLAMACGGFVILLAGVLYASGGADLMWEIVLISLGLVLLLVGKQMS